MRAKILSIGLATLSLVAVSTQNVLAHNTAKYTGVPFIIAASCPQFVSTASSKIISVNGRAVVQSVIDTGGDAGFDLFCSIPTSGTLPAASTQTFPEGTLTFYITGLPAGSEVAGLAVYTDNPTTSVDITGSVSGNFVTFPVNSPLSVAGSPVIQVQVFPEPPSGTATVQMSNFRYNNAAVLLDTTNNDQSATSGNFCSPF